MSEGIRKYQVGTIDDLTESYVSKLVVRVLLGDKHLKGVIGVSCTEDYVLYQDLDSSAEITLRLWSNMLSIHSQNAKGVWLTSAHYDGVPLDYVVARIWQDVRRAKEWMYKKHSSDETTLSNKLVDRVDQFKNLQFKNDYTKLIAIMLDWHHLPKPCPDLITVSHFQRETGFSRYKIRKLLKDLKELGYVKYGHEGGSGEDGVWCTHGYYLDRAKTLSVQNYAELDCFYKWWNNIQIDDFLHKDSEEI